MNNEMKRYASEDCVDSKINSAFEKHNTFTIEYAEPIKISLADIPIFNKVISNGTATYGIVEIVDGQTFIYTPTTYLLGAETVVLTFDDNTTYDVYINPADNIYYDASFFNIADATGWLYVEDETGSYAVATVDTGTNRLVPHFVGTGFALYGKYSLDDGALCTLLVERVNGGSTLARSATNGFNGYNVPVYEKVISEHDTWDVQIVRNKTNTEGAKLELSGIRIYNTIYDESSPSFTSVAEKVKKSNSDTNGTATSVIYLTYNTETKAFDRTLFDSALSNSQVYHAFEINKTGDSPKIWVSANAQPNKSTLSSVDSYNDNIAVSHSKSIHLNDGVMKFVPLETVNYNGKNYVLISSPTGITALGVIKCVDCEIVTQADQAAVNAFVEDVIRIANGTLIATMKTTKQLEEAIADYQGQLDGKQPIGNYLTEIPGEYVTETELEAEINDLKAQGVQQTPAYPQGETVEDQLAWLANNGDTGEVYLLADGNLYQYKMTETEVATGGYDNRLEKATETYNGTTIYGDGKGYVTDVRLSSSGSVSTSQGEGLLTTGFISATNGGSLDGARIRTVGFVNTGAPMNCYVIAYNASGEKIGYRQWSDDSADTYIADFTLDSETYGTGIKYIRISASAKGGTLPSIVTINEEIKEGSTTVVKDYAWADTGFAFVPADYEPRIIELERDVAELEKGSKIRNVLGISEVFAPSPQLPADGSEGSDFNGKRESITAEQIYTYIDALLNKYPRYITKEVMGKDASGTYDWNRYICCRRAYDAWQKPNYPPMYAWKNGSTTIYSVSVSPRIGDTLYTTTYIGTSKGTVTAVSNANQTRTVGGVVYTRDKTKDVAPTLVYTNTTYSPYFSSNYSSGRKEIYDSTKTQISTISSMSGGTLTGANSVSYTRYPLGDRNSDFEEIPAIVIGANEHGTGGDPATPAMISARMIKDLCECRNADNPLLNLLKNEYMMVFCPVINPWGFDKSNQKYTNSNEVNIDRNFDTPGWKANDPAGWDPGDYGGSENETQYFMNTLVASKTRIALANHSYGEGIDSTTGEAVSGGICSYMMGRNDSKYTESLLQIAEVMAANYNLVFTDNGEAKPEDWGKTRSYISWIGAEGGALEMNSRDGYITDPDNEAKGAQFTARVMEAAYTELLQYLYMLIDKQDA